MPLSNTRTKIAGFTLIELSIVLVIIGLIVGGILVGQDLIRSAEIRATISQIEKYQTAVNTFRGKYGYLPGDINAQAAAQFGFAARGTYPGQGDGNGLIEGVTSDVNTGGNNWGVVIFGGESAMFWVDLSKIGLIDGGFTQASILSSPNSVSSTQVSKYMPQAKLGRGNYVSVWSGGWSIWQSAGDGMNYFSISGIVGSISGASGAPSANAALTVLQAYSIDKKVDDGLPQSGRVMATINTAGIPPWSAGGGSDPVAGEQNYGDFDSASLGPVVASGDIGDGSEGGPPYGTVNTCYDGSQGLPERYSIQINAGAGVNCALSFRFQ